jgi:hypothetical protein
VILESKTVARSLIRRARVTVLAHRIRMLWHRGDYEDRFADVMLASVGSGDCIWDIGANLGYYTERFSKLAQHTVAFEPVVENCRQIESKMMANVEGRSDSCYNLRSPAYYRGNPVISSEGESCAIQDR